MSNSKKTIHENNLTDTDSYVNARLPQAFVLLVIAICVMPFLLNLIGVDFGTEKHASLSSHELQVISLRGAFEHTILEWTGFCIALCTAFLALSTRNLTTPLIGIALFFAGCMDAFHTLAADRLIEAVADNHNLIPFTWAICRLFDALIMIVVLGLFLIKGVNKLDANLKVGISFIFGLLAYAIIHLSATSATLPQTTYPDALITRPYDVAPLFLFIFAGLIVYPAFHKRYPSLFSHALLISVIPEIAVQLYMAFGSTALFDNNFNIAHFLKMMTYLVPFVGLCLDYVRTNVMLQEAYQFNKTILTVAPLGIASYRSDGQCVSANETIGTMIGTEQMLSQNFRQIEFWKNSALLADAEETLSTGVKKKREVHVVSRFGKALDIECYLSRFIINDEFHLLLMIHDITNRKQAEKALIEERASFAAARMKDSFFATMNHELRTPLCAILTMSDLLQDGIHGPLNKEQLKAINLINTSGSHLFSLINDILALSQLEAEKMKLDIKPIQIDNICQESLQFVESAAKKKQIKLFRADEGFVTTLQADEWGLKQILLNLLTNAVKFTPEGGQVSLEITGDEGVAQISVIDTGIGIPEDNIEYLFQPFVQLDSSLSRQYEGTGLGLSLIYKLTKLHGGSVNVESEIGKGSRFTISLPWQAPR
ncbi:MAG: ATP-binding protein [Pseudomonadota bacterium]